MLKYKMDQANNIFEFMLDGGITDNEFYNAAEKIEKMINENGSIKILEEIRSIGRMSPRIWWEGTKFDIKHLKDISHCAVVSDKGWIRPLAKATGVFTNCQIKVFPANNMNEARKWLREN